MYEYVRYSISIWYSNVLYFLYSLRLLYDVFSEIFSSSTQLSYSSFSKLSCTKLNKNIETRKRKILTILRSRWYLVSYIEDFFFYNTICCFLHFFDRITYFINIFTIIKFFPDKLVPLFGTCIFVKN